MRVLLVDDDAAVRALFRVWLSGLPDAPHVLEADTLQAAFDAVAQTRPDVVLLDQGLPDGDGLTGAARLLGVEPDLDIILVTGDDAPALERAAEELGIADFLLKRDINPRTLARSIRWARRRGIDRQALAASERHHRAVVRHLPGVAITIYDRDLRCIAAEGAFLADRGLDGSALLGMHVTEIGGDAGPFVAPMLQALGGTPARLEFPTDEGGVLDVEIVPYVGGDGETVGVINIARDVTAAHRAEQERRAAERRFAVAFERAPYGMAILGLDGRIRQVNAALCALTGRSERELLDGRPLDAVHPDDRARIAAAFAALSPDRPDVSTQYRSVSTDGEECWLDSRATLVLDDDGAPQYTLVQTRDVTEARREHDALALQASRDALTGLLNRRGYLDALHDHLAKRRRYGWGGAVIMLDLDGFKAVNDSRGHAAGDRVLQDCAAALTARLRESDSLGRLGGDEFAVLLPVAGAEEARGVAEALVATLADPRIGGAGVTVSAGVAVIGEDGASGEQLLAHADEALYRAKHAGKNRVAVA